MLLLIWVGMLPSMASDMRTKTCFVVNCSGVVIAVMILVMAKYIDVNFDCCIKLNCFH